MNERYFLLPDNRGVVILTEEVLSHMYSFSQTSLWSKEAGGQLFSATPERSTIRISVATGPYKQDKRSRFGFNPDTNKATQDRFIQFEKGLHSVGLWHTHPEKKPHPSNSDRQTTQKYLEAFQGDMQGFLSIIIGNKGNPPDLVVWIAWKNKEVLWLQLTEVSEIYEQHKIGAGQ